MHHSDKKRKYILQKRNEHTFQLFFFFIEFLSKISGQKKGRNRCKCLPNPTDNCTPNIRRRTRIEEQRIENKNGILFYDNIEQFQNIVRTNPQTHTHTYTHIRIHANYSEFPLKLFPAASSASIDIGIVIHPSIHPHFLPFVLCFWVIRYGFYFSGSFSSSLLPLRLVLVIGNYRQSHSRQTDTRAQIRCETKLFPVHKYRTTAATTTCSQIYKQKTTHHI